MPGKQHGPGPIIYGPPRAPRIAKNAHFCILWPIYEKLAVIFFPYYLPRRRRPGTGDIATPSVRLSVRPSVRPSVTFSFRTNSKTHCCIFSKLCRYVHQVMGVCYIVFDIDGMLFEFFMNFFKYWKNKILRMFFSKFHVFFALHAISNIKKK